eukprot:m.211241 g.211241  ORF g.211241 m.211241 type:complete len:200 (+) comp15559_c1_seq23:3781-4380(+)
MASVLSGLTLLSFHFSQSFRLADRIFALDFVSRKLTSGLENSESMVDPVNAEQVGEEQQQHQQQQQQHTTSFITSDGQTFQIGDFVRYRCARIGMVDTFAEIVGVRSNDVRLRIYLSPADTPFIFSKLPGADELLSFPHMVTTSVPEFLEDIVPAAAPFRIVSWYAYCRHKAAEKRAAHLGEPVGQGPALYYARLAVKM